jgi:hypothetical protein
VSGDAKNVIESRVTGVYYAPPPEGGGLARRT